METRSISVKKFILRRYSLVFFLVTLLICLVSALSARFQLRTSTEFLKREFDLVVMAEHNEFLDEIALHDLPSLLQHLKLLRERFNADSIELFFDSYKISASAPHNEGRFGFLNSWLTKVIGEQMMTVQFANEFGSNRSTVVVRFERLLVEMVVFPILVLTCWIILGTLLVGAAVFWTSFNQIESVLLLPLYNIAERLRRPSMAYTEPRGSRLREISELQKTVQRFEELQRQAAVAEVARQVGHDIRSPLTALQMAINDMPSLSQESRVLLRGACDRIRDVASQLLEKRKLGSLADSRSGTEIIRAEFLAPLIESVISEKRLQYGSAVNFELIFGPGGFGSFAKISAAQFKRVLSNLIDNSVQASTKKPEVRVVVEQNSERFFLNVEDDGAGIPADILPTLGKKGTSFNKPGGQGLGLYHAKAQVDTWGGEVAISSTVGLGTQVKISLPLVKHAEWFISEIRVATNAQLLIVDDDEFIHDLWRTRLKAIPKLDALRVRHFSDGKSFQKAVKKANGSPIICLVDYEFLGSETNGLMLIRELGIQSKSILVTHRAEDQELLTECVKERIKVIPKALANVIPIVVA